MLLEIFQAVTGIFVVVYDGQHGLKFRLGRAKHVVGPGVHFKLPIIERYRVEETKHTTLDLEPQVIQLADDLVYEVDCKVMYQIVDLRKALIQIDELVTGMQNTVVMSVQRVVQKQDRQSVRDTEAMVRQIRAELTPMEEMWGVHILQIGFSNISPSPSSLEITQLDLLSRERLELYHNFRAEGLPSEAAVALVTGAVVATGAGVEIGPVKRRAEDDAVRRAVSGWTSEAERAEAAERKARGEADPFAGEKADEAEDDAADDANGERGGA
jgi:regulator of protease activity HflC (stomatin/prohibitin superfamily)